MKVLFISSGQGMDYMSDTAFAGMRSLLGADLVDYPKVWHMYEDSFGEGKANKNDLYGRGFTLSGLFPKDEGIDRYDLPAKLNARYFDIIVYGSIHRSQLWFSGITQLYDAKKVAFIDGEDHPYVLLLEQYGAMFKRELYSPRKGIYPIHFGMPKEKILQTRPEKKQYFANYDPLVVSPSNYSYDNEKDYYQGYADSYFGATMKKAGFDCLRHWELLANWCMPYFRCLEALPATICTDLPRKEMEIVQRLVEYGNEAGARTAIDFYERTIDSVMNSFNEKCTTEAVAKYVLDTMSAL
jgi:hypothetical protein